MDVVCRMQGEPVLYAQDQDQAVLPFKKEFVPDINTADGFMEIVPPQGWLETCMAPKVIKPRRKQQLPRWKRKQLENKQSASSSSEDTAGLAGAGAGQAHGTQNAKVKEIVVDLAA